MPSFDVGSGCLLMWSVSNKSRSEGQFYSEGCARESLVGNPIEFRGVGSTASSILNPIAFDVVQGNRTDGQSVCVNTSREQHMRSASQTAVKYPEQITTARNYRGRDRPKIHGKQVRKPPAPKKLSRSGSAENPLKTGPKNSGRTAFKYTEQITTASNDWDRYRTKIH